MVNERVREASASGLPWFWLEGGERDTLGVASEVRVAERGREREFLRELRAESARRTADSGSRPRSGSEPGALRSGWIVVLGYEFGVGLLGLDPAPDNAPPAFALRVDTVPSCCAEAKPESQHPLSTSQAVRSCDALARPQDDGRAVWRRSATEYEADVTACLEAIRDGDAYVLCLTDTAEVRVTFDPLALYEQLRDRGPAMRGGVIATGDRALVSASPERFLSVRGGRVETHPIKGTRPRGRDPEHDAALAAELAADPKERAENLMIVDLMRNDLSRVCAPGSVGVEGFLRVETHPHVHQLVSTVSGELRDDCDIYDAIEACFPGGSMTGAPKRSAVEILAGLEGGPRGLYSGCFGWIDDSGDGELAMTIRSVELRGLGAADADARVGAGGGVTVDSDPEREHAEKLLKATPLLDVLADSVTRYP